MINYTKYVVNCIQSMLMTVIRFINAFDDCSVVGQIHACVMSLVSTNLVIFVVGRRFPRRHLDREISYQIYDLQRPCRGSRFHKTAIE